MTTNVLTTDSTPAPGDLERDRQLEVLLDELVTIPRGEELPADFAARVLDRRPFAPWEVSRASHWRLPAGIGLGLLAGSLGLALTPLWSLGPSTALTVWAELVAVAFGRPAATLVTALPLLAEGTGRAAQAVSPGAIALLGAMAGVTAASLGLALSRCRQPASSAAPRRG
jgi:hypothetical protein